MLRPTCVFEVDAGKALAVRGQQVAVWTLEASVGELKHGRGLAVLFYGRWNLERETETESIEGKWDTWKK